MTGNRADHERVAEGVVRDEGAEEVASLEGSPRPDRAAMSTVGLDPSGADLTFQPDPPPFDSVEPQPVD